MSELPPSLETPDKLSEFHVVSVLRTQSLVLHCKNTTLGCV